MKLLNNGENRVGLLMNDIVVDRELPKYKKILDSEKKTKSEDSYNTNFTSYNATSQGILKKLTSDIDFENFVNKADGSEFNLVVKEHLIGNIPNGFNMLTTPGDNSGTRSKKSGLISRFFDKFKWREKDNDITPNVKYGIDVLELFGHIKFETLEKTEDWKNKISSYVKLIKNAQICGQVAHEEELFSKLTVHVYESILSVSGYCKYISEEKLISLQKKCKRQLNLDYIKNFNRTIPNDIVEKKSRLDELLIFDNYAVLHYDPDGASFKDTKKEAERKKDPILFGMIFGSDKLYYVGDWVDEYCDLTLDQVVEKIGDLPELD